MGATDIHRRAFVKGAAVLAMTPWEAAAQPADGKKQPIRVGVIGCGSVSRMYLPHLAKSPHVELVSACDIIPERAETQGKKFGIANRYPHIDKMLAGVEFD